jgi:hypothetical protein
MGCWCWCERIRCVYCHGSAALKVLISSVVIYLTVVRGAVRGDQGVDAYVLLFREIDHPFVHFSSGRYKNALTKTKTVQSPSPNRSKPNQPKLTKLIAHSSNIL